MEQRDLIDTSALTGQDMTDLMNLALALRACVRQEYFPPLLKHRTVGLLAGDMGSFEHAAYRLAVEQLGARLMLFAPDVSVPEDAERLSLYCDLLAVRPERHEQLLLLKKGGKLPVLSAGSPYCAPVQELADMLTMYDHMPKEKRLETCKLVYIGPMDARCNSALFLATKLGMQFAQLSEKGGQLTPPLLKIAEDNVKKSGGVYAVTEDAAEAFRDADFIVAREAPAASGSGAWYVDPLENLLTALRALFVMLLYSDPLKRDAIQIEKVRRTLATKLQGMFGFAEAND